MKKIALKKKGLSINTYGYEFGRADLAMTLLAFSIGSWLVCYLHRLDLKYTLIVIATMVCTIPFVVTGYYQNKFEQKKFEDYCTYFEKMIMYFKSRKKIKLALEGTLESFEGKSRMKDCIQKAINEINATGDYKKALNYIDEKFHTSDLVMLHTLLITGEQKGSDSIYELLDGIDFDFFKQTISIQQNAKKKWRFFLYGIVLFSLFFSFYGANLLNDPIIEIDMEQFYLYTFVDIECMLLLFVYLYYKIVTGKWIRSDD